MFIYNNVYILWIGKVVNVSVNEERIIFDLIIGDEEMGIVDAIIPVVFNKAIIVNNNDMVGIFGKIIIEEESTYIDGRYVIKNIE